MSHDGGFPAVPYQDVGKEPAVQTNAKPGAAAPGNGGLDPDQRAETLIPMLRDTDPRVRKSAVIALGRMSGRRAAELVCDMLADPDEGVRVLSCQALGRLADPASLEALLTRKHDSSVEVRSGVLWAIANIVAHGGLTPEGVEAMFAPVVVFAFDPDDSVRADAAAVLGALKTPRASEPLRIMLEDESPRVRANACSGLGMLDDDEGFEALVGRLGDSSATPLETVSALDGLARRFERMGEAAPSDPAGASSGLPLIQEAAKAVLAFCPTTPQPEGWQPEPAAAQPGSPQPEPTAPQPEPTADDVYATAVWALGMVAPHVPGMRDAVQAALESALRCPDPWGRRYAAESLARIHDDAAYRALCGRIDEGSETVPEVVQTLRKARESFGAPDVSPNNV